MADEDLAWLAGFFDGEGSVGIYTRGPSEKQKGSSLRALLTQRSRTVLDEVRATFGGTVRQNKTGAHVWLIDSPRAAEFLTAIRPYLRLKGEQVDVGLSFQQRRKWGVPSRTPEKDLEDAARLKELKRAA